MGFDLDSYVDVAERIATFREKHPEGSLQSEVIHYPDAAFPQIVVKAYAYRTPDDIRPGVGLAGEPVPGPTQFTKDSELQNAETASWGRAIVAALAADTKRGVASADEVRNRSTSTDSSGGEGTLLEYINDHKPKPSEIVAAANATGSTDVNTVAQALRLPDDAQQLIVTILAKPKIEGAQVTNW